MEQKRVSVRQQNRDITLLLIAPTAILAKIIYMYFLPSKYFFDSWRMIDMLVNGEKSTIAWTGYQQAVDFHKAINIFHFNTINQFSTFYGLIMTIVIMFIVSKAKEMDFMDSLFTLMATGVLNIYVFCINKEMIQILYFILIYIIITSPIKNTMLKLIGCVAVYYWESTSFRSYYIIMAAMSVLLYFAFTWLKRRNKVTKLMIVTTVIICFVGVFAFFYASSFVAHDDYIDALNVRDSSTSTIREQGGANSAIYNPIEVNGNLGVFMIDYVINAFRMMIPIELLLKSPGYAPFFVYQIFILVYLFKALANIKTMDKKMVVALSCFVAYFFGSVVFEPDFGSWVRHEATTFPVFQLLVYQNRTQNNVMTKGMVKNEATYV
ncbi:hypothetical protein [Eubacterium sp.]|uniref:hypothetical protein n=1 Tax=Eubacterium sp. TaxID=142586 RepID=UPI003521D0BB